MDCQETEAKKKVKNNSKINEVSVCKLYHQPYKKYVKVRDGLDLVREHIINDLFLTKL